MEQLICLNIVYFIVAYLVVFPPADAISLGFSIPTLFSSITGSEHMFFIYHHMNRILVTIAVHSLLPLSYFVFMGFCSDLGLFDLKNLNLFWQIYLNMSILFAAGSFTIVFYWKMNDYCNHPIAKKLKNFSLNAPWQSLANQINVEFRRVEKFQSGSLFYRVYVTDNWLIKVSLYSIDICNNNVLDVILTHANDIFLTQDGSPVTQYLHLTVKSVESPGISQIKPFSIRLNSLEYAEFNNKLNRPIREACNIIIRQTLPEQFLDAFRLQITENVKFNFKRDEVETCVGCMRKLADVKLIKSCTGDCTECFCRPMWCLECLGKWFAYRQDQNEPSTWLGSKATCATCRAKFCILDVAMINFLD